MSIYDKFIRYSQLRQARAAVKSNNEVNYVHTIRNEATDMLTEEMNRVADEIKTYFELTKRSRQ